MIDQPVHLKSIGNLAFEILSTQHVFKLLGETSRGYFLHGTDNRIIFLTSDQYRGPFTLNLSHTIAFEMEHGQTLEVNRHRLYFPDCHIVDFNKAEIWSPASFNLDGENPDPTPALKECVTFAQAEGKHSLSDLLPVLLKQDTNPVLSMEQERILAALISFRKHFQAGEIIIAVRALLEMIGLGRGLTPSADDLICGLLLYFKRYSSGIQFGGIRKGLLDVMKSKQLRTTSVSYQLLGAAHEGLADERVITALDLLARGSMDSVHIYQLLSGYGNTSGLDLLTGWVAAYQLVRSM